MRAVTRCAASGLATLLLAVVVEAQVIERVSIDSQGNDANAESGCPAASADGRIVAFESAATNLVPGDTNGVTDVFVHDRDTGTTTRVSVDSAGVEGNDRSLFPAISGDGRYVAFQSFASNLVPGDTNGSTDIIVHDRQTGITSRVNLDSSGNQSAGSGRYPALEFGHLAGAFGV